MSITGSTQEGLGSLGRSNRIPGASVPAGDSSVVAWYAVVVLFTAIAVVAVDTISYGALCVVTIGLQIIACALVWRRVQRVVSVCMLVVGAWLVYYVVRSVTIMVATDPVYDHYTVITAGEPLRAEIWIGTTVAVVALAGGMIVGTTLTKVGPRLLVPARSESTLRLIGFLGLFATIAMPLAGLQSGLAGNVAGIYLFAIASLSYMAARRRRIKMADAFLAVSAILLGSFLSFKEPAVMTFLALLVGYLAAGNRVRKGVVVLVLLGAIAVFGGIQAQRIAAVNFGRESTILDLPSNIYEGLTQYDLGHSIPKAQEGWGLVLNPLAGVTSRVRGTDAMFALRDKVPEKIPFQEGRSIIEPILSSVPVVGESLAPTFPSLSLGRYYAVTFWTYSQRSDPSSQAITVVGDLFLNAGWSGVLVGMALLGLGVSILDRRFPPFSFAGAGFFAYVFLPLIALERNVGYLFLTLMIRFVVALAVLRLIRAIRVHDGDPGRPGLEEPMWV